MSTPHVPAPKRPLWVDIAQALAIGAACYLFALFTPVAAYSLLPSPDPAPQATAAAPVASPPPPRALTPFDMVRSTTVMPVLETLPYLLVAWLLFGTRVPRLIGLPLYLALSFAYGYFGHGGGLWNVGRGAAYLLLGWQFYRYVPKDRVPAGFWLTSLAHAAYNGIVVAAWAIRNL